LPSLTSKKTSIAGSTPSEKLPHEIWKELPYLPDTLLYRRIEWTVLIAFASAIAWSRVPIFKREPCDSGKLRRDQSRRGA
jgi:hypothetical protein